MKHSPRLYYCVLCHAQAVIGSCCDRGQIYCSHNCSKIARFKSCREAKKRYQLTPWGKSKHAARQKRYRMRQKQKVTDQGSVVPTDNGLLEPVKNKTMEGSIEEDSWLIRCCICKKPVSSWFRNSFLRYYNTQSGINLSYLRPP
jgi:hypothetical protein